VVSTREVNLSPVSATGGDTTTRARNAAKGDPMAKGQAKKEKKNKPKLSTKEKQANKAAKRAEKAKK